MDSIPWNGYAMQPDPVLTNPYLGYRLDPYEPGLIRRAKASQSTLQVVAQEQRNLTRLRQEALREGRTLVSQGIEYRPAIAGSYMGTAAGQTTVISLEKIREKTTRPVDLAGKISEKTPGTEGLKELDPIEPGQSMGDSAPIIPDPQLNRKSTDELSQEEQLVRIEIQNIRSKIDQADTDQAPEQGKIEAEQAAQEKHKLDREMEEKKEELRKIGRTKLAKMQSELMTSLNQGFVQNSLAPLAMIKAAYAGGPEPPGQSGLDQVV